MGRVNFWQVDSAGKDVTIDVVMYNDSHQVRGRVRQREGERESERQRESERGSKRE
jgi:hypothetical protein